MEDGGGIDGAEQVVGEDAPAARELFEAAGGRDFEDVDDARDGKGPERGQHGLGGIVEQQDGEQEAGDFVGDEDLAVFALVVGFGPAAEGDGDPATRRAGRRR